MILLFDNFLNQSNLFSYILLSSHINLACSWKTVLCQFCKWGEGNNFHNLNLKTEKESVLHKIQLNLLVTSSLISKYFHHSTVWTNILLIVCLFFFFKYYIDLDLSINVTLLKHSYRFKCFMTSSKVCEMRVFKTGHPLDQKRK